MGLEIILFKNLNFRGIAALSQETKGEETA